MKLPDAPEVVMRKVTRIIVLFAGLLGCGLLGPPSAFAAWPSDPLVNVPLCTEAADQTTPVVVSDGAGGAIVAWADARDGNRDIYVQRISPDGLLLWAPGGVALSAAAGDQANPTIIADGAGGAIVTWHDFRSGATYDIYAQQVSAAGAPQWTADGVEICTAANHQQFPTLASDDAGGAIVTWFDLRTGNYDVYAQRVSVAGAVQWTADGVAISAAARHQEYPTIVPDGAGGAVITWFDQRTGNGYMFSDIYAQRISADGAVQWTADGVPLCTATGDQSNPTIASDGASGAIVSWFDYRNGNYDIFAQRIDAAGAVQWTADGVALSTVAGEQAYPTIISDVAGGAIVTWRDRGGDDYDIYTQRISGAGAIQWAPNGVALCAAPDDQYDPTIAPDGAGGTIITWYDYRHGSGDIFARRILANGTPQWTPDGVALCKAPGTQNVCMIAPDMSGGAIIAWADERGANKDIYAQRVDQDGALGGAPRVDVPVEASVAFALDRVFPNPARGGAMRLHLSLPDAEPAALQLVDVRGRLIAAREVGSLGAGRHVVDLTDGLRLSAGVYLVRLTRGGQHRTTRAVVL
jgi:hypothetical protein